MTLVVCGVLSLLLLKGGDVQNLDSRDPARLSVDAEAASVQPLRNDDRTSLMTYLPAQRGFRRGALRPVCFGTAGLTSSRVELPLPSEVSRLRSLQAVWAQLINNSVQL